VEETLYEIHQRLQDIVIENLPWSECLQKYDSPETWFFLDPPYYGNEMDYDAEIDFGSLAEHLRGLKGNFMLTINDVPETREIFRGFVMEEIKRPFSISTKSGKPASQRQLIVLPEKGL